jgi:molybdopterin converting factor small subunit
MIRVQLPTHLRRLAQVSGEVSLSIDGTSPVTQGAMLDALEARYPMLKGTIRDQVTGKRRGFVRFFACQTDVSNEPPDSPLPELVRNGETPFLIVGAMAGG